LPKYEKLYEKNSYTRSDSDYKKYLELEEELYMATAMGADTTEILTEMNGLGLSSNETSGILSVMESAEFDAYSDIFSSIGVTSPLSDKEEYETFVYIIDVVPVTLEKGIGSMETGVEVAKASVASGVSDLYDGLLSMYEGLEMLTKSYELAEENYASLESKYEKGLVSSMALAQGENDVAVALLEKNKMAREIENMEMTLKQMIGLNLTQPISLDEDLSYEEDLWALESYIVLALNNRNELITLTNSIEAKEAELTSIKDYFSSTEPTYKIAEGELSNLSLELEQTKIEIELEIRQAYVEVSNTKNQLDVAYREYLDIQDDFEAIKKYYEVGLVPLSSVNSYELLVLQKESAYKGAIRTYNSTLTKFEAAYNLGIQEF
jgi:outer membrane protein TolC